MEANVAQVLLYFTRRHDLGSYDDMNHLDSLIKEYALNSSFRNQLNSVIQHVNDARPLPQGLGYAK